VAGVSDTPAPIDPEELIERLRARAGDPRRRTELRPAGFGAIRAFFSLDGSRARRPASARALREAEAALGTPLPAMLARAYTEVGDGGYGPGTGLLPLEKVVRETRELRSGDALPHGRTWPPTLLPVVPMDPGWTCVDAATGAVVDWDPEELQERSSERRFRASFSERSSSVDAWLDRWVRSKTAADRSKPSQAERRERMRARAMSPEGQARQAARTRAALARLTPEERARWGLDDLLAEDETTHGGA
jgi:hypothetical protein